MNRRKFLGTLGAVLGSVAGASALGGRTLSVPGAPLFTHKEYLGTYYVSLKKLNESLHGQVFKRSIVMNTQDEGRL